jgi:DNA-binding PadR family transcriptional regulator
MSRRRPGTLLGLEVEILEAALSMQRSGDEAVYGFALAQAMREESGSSALTSHGTLYKALNRLEEFGHLASSWEDASVAEGRPRRRLYRVTGQGIRAVEQARAVEPGRPAAPTRRRRGVRLGQA